MDGWNTILSFWDGFFSLAMLVSESVIHGLEMMGFVKFLVMSTEEKRMASPNKNETHKTSSERHPQRQIKNKVDEPTFAIKTNHLWPLLGL